MKDVKKLLMLSFLFLIFTGCTMKNHAVTSEITPVRGYTHDIPPIYLPLAFRRAPYVEGFSKHFTINNSVSCKYYCEKILVDFDLDYSHQRSIKHHIAFLSFFIPPMSLIKHPSEIQYSITYTIKDVSDKTVLTNTINSKSTGYFQGWYGDIDRKFRGV